MNNKLMARLHPRNRYQGHYDFAKLTSLVPELSSWLRNRPYGGVTLDFSEPEAVRLLNQALLYDYYQLHWQLAPGSLCPPVPGRADYIHHLADLLACDNHGIQPSAVHVLDIGCGANCIYPLIGHAEYGWRFTGSEINKLSIQSALSIIAANPGLQKNIRLRRQRHTDKVFTGIIQPNEHYHLTLCNPPFHTSAEAAKRGSDRKMRHLKLDSGLGLNFAGMPHELYCEGGEKAFIIRMIKESEQFKHQVDWFSCLVSSASNLPAIKHQLNCMSVSQVQVVKMGQGNKISRFIAWRYLKK